MAIVKRWLPLLIAGALVLAIPAFLYGSARSPQYEASTRLMVTTATNAGPDDVAVAIHRAADFATLAGTREFAQAVIDQQGLTESIEALQGRLSATAAANTALLTITARDPDPVAAAKLANGASDLLRQRSVAAGGGIMATDVASRLAAIDAQIAATSKRIGELSSTVEPSAAEQAELAAQRAALSGLLGDYAAYLGLSTTVGSGQLTTIDAAYPPVDRAGIGTFYLTLLAALVGVFVASSVAFVLAWRRDGLYGPGDLEEALEVRDMGLVEERTADVRRGGVTRLMAGRSARAAATFRTIRGAITIATAEVPSPAVLVCSTFPEKTIVAADLAISYAGSGRRVLLIDADLARPSAHTLFGIGNRAGLATFLERVAEPPGDTLGVPTSFPGLWVLTAGPTDAAAAEFLESPRMRELIVAAKHSYEVVVVDGPALLGASDAVVLAATMDVTVLVVDQEGSRRAQLIDVRERLRAAGATVVGLVRYRQSRWTGVSSGSAGSTASTERPGATGPIERPGRP